MIFFFKEVEVFETEGMQELLEDQVSQLLYNLGGIIIFLEMR